MLFGYSEPFSLSAQADEPGALKGGGNQERWIQLLNPADFYPGFDNLHWAVFYFISETDLKEHNFQAVKMTGTQ
jgi:hypothetical protein